MTSKKVQISDILANLIPDFVESDHPMFKEFLDQVGHDKACMIMHTDPKDQHGQDLERIIHDFDMTSLTPTKM